MNASSPFSIAAACVQRCDHGADRPLTAAEAIAQVQHPLTGLSRDKLVEVVAYLACQVVGRSRDLDADAALAIQQVRRIVHEYEKRHGSAA